MHIHLVCMWHVCIFLKRKSHSFHYLLKFVRRLKITPLLTLPTQSHPHPDWTSAHTSMTSNLVSLAQNPLQSLISNCPLHTCLWMLKNLQLVQNQAFHPPQQLSALLLYLLHHPENLGHPRLLPLPHSPHPSPLPILALPTHSPHLGLHQFSAVFLTDLPVSSHSLPSTQHSVPSPG